MTSCIVELQSVTEGAVGDVGGKAVCLAALAREGISVAPGFCITVEAYEEFVARNGIAERIGMELARKRFDDMRWEEIWDSSLRIRNLFIRGIVSQRIQESIRAAVDALNHPVVVRSSSPKEDTKAASHAGLHASYVNVLGGSDVVEKVKLVWASLWSDRALVYRHELGITSVHQAMAVLVQVMQHGQRSGVVFGQSPMDPEHLVIEAVHGLNQGLVDGTIEPDRWTLDRASGRLLRHDAPARTHHVVPSGVDVTKVALSDTLAEQPPLGTEDIQAVRQLSSAADRFFGCPQDVEFTFLARHLVCLQTRPISTSTQGPDGAQGRSQHQTLESLERLHERIVNKLLPAVDASASALAAQRIAGVSDEVLAQRIEERLAAHLRHSDVYTADFIPFAHGVRLFGEVYNDSVRPEDPFSFLDLLAGAGLEGMARNERLAALAQRLRDNQGLRRDVEEGRWDVVEPSFLEQLDAFIDDYAHTSWSGSRCLADRRGITSLIVRMASGRNLAKAAPVEDRERAFLASMGEEQGDFARRVLHMGKESYRLRDDDNLHVGRVAGLLEEAVEVGRQRLEGRGVAALGWSAIDVARGLRDQAFRPTGSSSEPADRMSEPGIRARQLLGQPAGRGVGVGPARVVEHPSDLFEVQRGEVLVCDAIDPNMTFFAPLVVAIVERRGGMLIHGAIIAREYGLPCVTGVPDVTKLIRTGDPLTVDGFLGIVTVGRPVGEPVMDGSDA
jgi:phosphoenolpyruvate synthase/pyruvate phosphate dikinase